MRTKEEIFGRQNTPTINLGGDVSFDRREVEEAKLEVLIDIRDILQGEEIERYMRDRELITLTAHNDIVERLEEQLGAGK